MATAAAAAPRLWLHGGRIMSAGMAVAVQQDAKALAAVAAAAAAGGNFCQQQPWQRRTSAALTSGSNSAAASGCVSSSLGASPLRVALGNHAMLQQSWTQTSFLPKLSCNVVSTRATQRHSMNRVGLAVTKGLKPRFLCQEARKEELTTVDATEEGSKESENPQNGLDKTDPEHRNLQLDCAAAMLPHPSKAAKGGEDAFFMEGSWIGVADGVGGWAAEGIDAGLHSRELMTNCKALASEKKGKPEPKSVLLKAVSSIKAQGSTTVLVAALFEQTLYAANLGDAGFIVVRDWEVVARSNPMQHSFNFPYQVGDYGDDPSLAETYEVSVCKGDIIVLGTDGLFDNLFDSHIVKVLKGTIGAGIGVQAAATHLVKSAQVVGASQDAESPFSNAARAARVPFTGGKLDDVTTVVAFVT